jgi:hypothetical protein
MSDINSQRNEPGKSLAIAFYEKEHILQPDERKQLHKFFKGQSVRVFFSLVLCYGIALGAVLILIKMGYKSVQFFVLCFLVAYALHWLPSAKLCELHLEKFRKDVGETSNVFETAKVTPDTTRTSRFLSKYFKNSCDNPNMRMRDPRRSTDSFSYNPFEEKLGQIEVEWLVECGRIEQSSIKDKMLYIWFKRIRKEKHQAIAFYRKEHVLQSNERKQLSEFFNKQSDLTRYSFESCSIVCIGVALVLKRMRFIDFRYLIWGPYIGTLLNKLVEKQLYNQSLEKFKKSVGETSNAFRTLKVTPDPMGKGGFWSYYFKDSSENPNIRMRDPRSITDSPNSILTNYIQIEGKFGKIQEKELEECNRSEYPVDKNEMSYV